MNEKIRIGTKSKSARERAFKRSSSSSSSEGEKNAVHFLPFDGSAKKEENGIERATKQHRTNRTKLNRNKKRNKTIHTI